MPNSREHTGESGWAVVDGTGQVLRVILSDAELDKYLEDEANRPQPNYSKRRDNLSTAAAQDQRGCERTRPYVDMHVLIRFQVILPGVEHQVVTTERLTISEDQRAKARNRSS